MRARKTFLELGPLLVALLFAGVGAGQSPPTPAPPAAPQSSPAQPSAQSPGSALAPLPSARSSVTFDGFVDAALIQERRLLTLMRYYRPVVETYIQEDAIDSKHRGAPKRDEYFLSRLDLTGKNPSK